MQVTECGFKLCYEKQGKTWTEDAAELMRRVSKIWFDVRFKRDRLSESVKWQQILDPKQ